MNILPKIRTRFGENIGVEVMITPPDLSDNNHTFLTTDYAAAVTTLAVDNGNKFSANDYVVIGQIGGEKTEIVKISSVTSSTITTDSTAFAHNRGEKITFIPYNQIVPERSTDAGVNYSALSAISIRPDSTETYFQRSSDTSTNYYRVRFYNSTSALYSQYSDGMIATGYTEASAGSVIRAALVSMGERIDDVITKEFLYTALNDGRDEVDKMPGIERWSFRNVFDYAAGNVVPGHNRLTLPTDLREPDTFKNILSIRIGKAKLPVNPRDKTSLNRWYEGVARTTLSGAAVTSDVVLSLTKSGDFSEAGSVTVAGAAVTDTLDDIDYTANTESTNTLSGVTGIQAAGHSSGAIVWQGASFGYPTEYTVDSGEVVFSQPFDDDLAGEIIYMDYYAKLSDINSDADALDEPGYKMYIPYLRYRIKKRRDKNLKRDDDDDYKTWMEKRNAAVTKEFLGQDVRLIIDIPNP